MSQRGDEFQQRGLMKKISQFEQHYSVQGAARLLALSVPTVWRALRDRKIRPSVKIGRLTRIPASALERFVEERAV